MRENVLKVFLCHAIEDKAHVRDLNDQLKSHGVDAWLDEKKLLPGHDWKTEIDKALCESHAVLICLSKEAVGKSGIFQKEIKRALDIAEEKPEGTIFIIPVRLEECVLPRCLNPWHWVNLFEHNGFELILEALRERGKDIGVALGPVPPIVREGKKDEIAADFIRGIRTGEWEGEAFQIDFDVILMNRVRAGLTVGDTQSLWKLLTECPRPDLGNWAASVLLGKRLKGGDGRVREQLAQRMKGYYWGTVGRVDWQISRGVALALAGSANDGECIKDWIHRIKLDPVLLENNLRASESHLRELKQDAVDFYLDSIQANLKYASSRLWEVFYIGRRAKPNVGIIRVLEHCRVHTTDQDLQAYCGEAVAEINKRR